VYFPFGLNGSVRIRVAGSDRSLIPEATRRVEDMLDAAFATKASAEGSTVQFTNSMFQAVGNWNILAPFGAGVLDIQQDFDCLVVRYRLNTTQMFLVVLAMLALVAALVWNSTNNFTVLPPLIGGWVCIFGINYLIAMLRFRRWLRSGLKSLS